MASGFCFLFGVGFFCLFCVACVLFPLITSRSFPFNDDLGTPPTRRPHSWKKPRATPRVAGASSLCLAEHYDGKVRRLRAGSHKEQNQFLNHAHHSMAAGFCLAMQQMALPTGLAHRLRHHTLLALASCGQQSRRLALPRSAALSPTRLGKSDVAKQGTAVPV